jgi:hypothetical protein
MAGTRGERFIPPNPAIAFHLDPWHKMRLGWTRPEVYNLLNPGICKRLVRPDATTDSSAEAVILVDPRRGPDEFYMLEYRSRGVSLYDRDAADLGLAVWYVRTRRDKTLDQVVGRITPGRDEILQSTPSGDDVLSGSVILPGPNGIVDSSARRDDARSTDFLNLVSINPLTQRARGGARFFDASDGVLVPRWFDGTPAGFQIQVQSFTPGATALNVIWTDGRPNTIRCP